MYEFTLWLAYADVIDNKIEKIQQGLVELQNKLYGTGNAIQSITKTLDKLFQRQDELFQRQNNIIKLLEVVYNNLPEVLIPDWRTLEESKMETIWDWTIPPVQTQSVFWLLFIICKMSLALSMNY